MQAKDLDPVTFEILRHRMEEIVGEMYYVMGRVSGSPIIYQVGDHEEAILDADGETVMVGGGIVEWTYSLEAAGKHLVRQYEENPGIYEGDQFILNDAYVACVHAMDVQVLAPVFWEGKRVAWVVSAGHQTDVGGMAPSSYCPEATEVYQEGLQIPGLKIVEKGRVRKDVEETIRSMVRLPDLGMLEISSKIAANNTATTRLIETIERWGIDTLLAFFDQLKRYSQERVGIKLREIPDGSWEAIHYIESLKEPKEPYLKVQVTLIKEGDSLTMDFTGSSPQSEGSQNVSRIGAISNALCPYLTLLCHDIPWSAGVWRPVKFIIPEGTWVNPKRPAPTSYNTPPGGGFIVIAAVHDAVSKMLLSTEKLRHEAFASSSECGGSVVSGINKDGTPFVQILMEDIAGGMGGLADKDGDDTCANMWTPKTQIVNIETDELVFPVLYLYRKEIRDGGGPGKFRGGCGIATGLIPWDTPAKEIVCQDVSFGRKPRCGSGLAGGYPAPSAQWGVIRNSDILEKLKGGQFPRDIEEIKGETELVPSLQARKIGERDVLFVYNLGGGGYGDPIAREPGLVLEDVKTGYVSVGAAKDVYGVVIDPGTFEVDLKKTGELRQQMVQERLETGRK
jgi:N-methylhydantoinase B